MKKCNGLEDCVKVFVSWSWLVGILITMLLGASSIVYIYGREQITISYKLVEIQQSVDRERQRIDNIVSIKADLDSIKHMLKAKP